MNNDHVKGGVNQVKGRVKEEIGHVTGDNSLAGEGVLDRVKGKIQEGYGDIKDAVKEKVDHLLGHDDKKS